VAAEAMAFLRADYLPDLDAFLIHRRVSDAKVIERTKTGDQHLIPCHRDFKPYLEQALKERPLCPYLFTCDESRVEGKRYNEKIYRRILKEACTHCNEVIDVYRGTKTSTASQLMNEVGLSRAELQEAGDWARYESTEPYARASTATKRNLLERKVINLDERRVKNEFTNPL
jgi:hypothetical protein